LSIFIHYNIFDIINNFDIILYPIVFLFSSFCFELFDIILELFQLILQFNFDLNVLYDSRKLSINTYIFPDDDDFHYPFEEFETLLNNIDELQTKRANRNQLEFYITCLFKGL